MAPKTGSKKPVETWRPERDLDCSAPHRAEAFVAIQHDEEREQGTGYEMSGVVRRPTPPPP